MDFWTKWRGDAIGRERLRAWRADGALDENAWRRALDLIGPWPDPVSWRWFLRGVTLWLAVALLGAAVICFIAANWEALGRAARLYGLQAAIVLATLAAWRLRLDRPAGQAALLLAGILLGGLLALIGQTYQTGADTWQLFAVWSALLVPWLVAGVSMPTSLLWLAVTNVGLFLLVDERSSDDAIPWIAIGLLDVGALLLWQWLGRHAHGLRGRTGPRIAAAAGLVLLTLAAFFGIVIDRDSVVLSLLAWLAGAALVFWRAWQWPRDLVLLALVALSVIVVDTTLAARGLVEIRDPDSGVFLLLAVMVIGQASLASVWLRRLAQREEVADD